MKEVDNQDKNPSMEQILQTIRGVIAGDDSKEDVLELTEMINEDGSISSLTKSTSKNLDVLTDIDNIISEVQTSVIDKKAEKNLEPIINRQDSIQQQNIKEQATLNIESSKEVNKLNLNTDTIKPLDNFDLISKATAKATAETLKSFAKSVSKPIDQLNFRSGESIEDLVKELIKPYIKTWLDENLPIIVKHLVEKEIQKLIPKDDY